MELRENSTRAPPPYLLKTDIFRLESGLNLRDAEFEVFRKVSVQGRRLPIGIIIWPAVGGNAVKETGLCPRPLGLDLTRGKGVNDPAWPLAGPRSEAPRRGGCPPTVGRFWVPGDVRVSPITVKVPRIL